MDNNCKKIKFGFTAIAIACVFLFNANIIIIDPIPDIVGYLIICVALLKLSDLNEDVAVSAKFFRYMVLSEIGKAAALLWLFGLSRSDERDTGMLLFSFAFAVIDTMILVNAFGKLFNGLVSLGYAHSNTSILGSKRTGGKSYTDKIRSLTLFFVIFKAGMATLPEFSNLASYEYDESSGLVDIYDFIGLMRGMSFVIVTVVGIVWLVRAIRYFVRVNKDAGFNSSICATYENDILPKRGLFIKRDMGIAFFVIGAAGLFMLDFRIDYINLIPDFVGAILFILGLLICARHLSVNKKFIVSLSSVYLLTAIISYVTEIRFFEKYFYSSVYRDTAAYNSYVLMCVISVLEIVGFCAMVVTLIYCLNALIKEHTGYVYGTDISKDSARIETYQKESQRRLVYVAIGAFLAVVADTFYTFFAIRSGYAGAISIIGAVVFAVSVIKVTQELLEEVKTKYMLE